MGMGMGYSRGGVALLVAAYADFTLQGGFFIHELALRASQRPVNTIEGDTKVRSLTQYPFNSMHSSV